jgi:hypothetical protein
MEINKQQRKFKDFKAKSITIKDKYIYVFSDSQILIMDKEKLMLKKELVFKNWKGG